MRRILRPATFLAIAGIAVVLAAVLVVAAHVITRPRVGTTIDGFPVGAAIPCDAMQPCDTWIPLARAALDHRDPGHAGVIGETVYGEDFHNTEVYPEQSVLRGRSGGFVIVVFSLADGSQRATGVGCLIGGCSGMGTYAH